MMRSQRRTLLDRGLVVVALVLLSPLLAACEDADSEAIAQLAVDWAVEKGLMSLECSGPGQSDCTYDLNEAALGAYLGIARIGGSLGGMSPEMQAALDAGDVVQVQEEDDELAEKGAREGNLELIDQAIESRPEDWSYHDQRAALLLAQGDTAAAEKSFAEAESLVDKRIAANEDCYILKRNLLNNRMAAINIQLDRYPTNAELNDRLAGAHEQLQALEAGGPGSPCAP
jgi:tetratricopeptide (TPR) repeat protein